MKILLLLPDGVGVRNFIYTDFVERAINAGHEIVAWADENVLSLIEDQRVNKIPLPKEQHTNTIIEIQRRAWSIGMLRWQAKKFDNPVYLSHIFRIQIKSLRDILRIIYQEFLTLKYKDYSELRLLKRKYGYNFSRLKYYKKCEDQIMFLNPDLIFCTHQRASKAIAPLIVSRNCSIPTACFIYSWDNLPKGNLYVDADFYLVWSQHMKKELQTYYPEVDDDRILITGTPQFVPYFDKEIITTRNDFAVKYNLPADRLWICFSGDDITTSPYDQEYLDHLAEAIRKWNSRDAKKIHILFRRCPVDTSGRFDEVLCRNKDNISEVRPLWSSIDPKAGWDRQVAKREDTALLVNTVYHSEFVVNIGSTMAHDFVVYNKPCIYINYQLKDGHKWDINRIYKYLHFQTIEDLVPVVWITNKNQWSDKIRFALYNSKMIVEDCRKWHQKVALYPLQEANERIIQAFEKIVG